MTTAQLLDLIRTGDAVTNSGQIVFPIYLVFDPANQGEPSMVDFANQLIVKIFREIHSDPVFDIICRIRIVEIRDNAESILPLSQLSNISTSPGIFESPVASLHSVFENLKIWISDDVTKLQEEGRRVLRPIVFVFLGRSTYQDDWRDAHRELTDRTFFRFAPNIFCFGTCDVNSQVIHDIASTGTEELNQLAATVMDLGVGIDILVKGVVEEYILRIIRTPFEARALSSPTISFPSTVLGLSPAVPGPRNL